jgi:hypothetical protein
VSACLADMDTNGVINIFDFLTFQSFFSVGDARADVAAPFGALNVFDFLGFQALFGAGC